MLFQFFRDRLEDMRFMYETVAETAGHISFDSIDPFYDSLPWFRLIGRYVLWMLKLIITCLWFFLALCTCCSISISRQAYVPFSRPLVLLHFTSPPPPPSLPLLLLHLPILWICCIFSLFLLLPRLAALRFIQPFALVALFPPHCILPLQFAQFVGFCFKVLKFCYFSLVFFFNCCGYYYYFLFAFKLNWLPKWNS